MPGRQLEGTNHLPDVFYTMPDRAQCTLTKKEWQETALWTGGDLLACGHTWNLKGEKIAPGIYWITTDGRKHAKESVMTAADDCPEDGKRGGVEVFTDEDAKERLLRINHDTRGGTKPASTSDWLWLLEMATRGADLRTGAGERGPAGLLACDDCGFVGVFKVLATLTGEVGADREGHDCPNGCGPLRQMTWREHAESLAEAQERLVDRLTDRPDPSTRIDALDAEGE